MSGNQLPVQCLEHILESLPVGLALNSANGNGPGYANRLFLEIYNGWNKGEFTDLASFLESNFPQSDKKEAACRSIQQDAAQIIQPTNQLDNIRITCPDGTVKIVAARNQELTDLGLILDTVQDFTDQKITEQYLRQSERRYQTLTETSSVGIFRLGPDGCYQQVNRAWREISGLKESQVLGHPWGVAVHPDDRQTVLDHWQEAFEFQTAFKTECRFRLQSGRIIWVYVQADPVIDEKGTLEGFVGSATDISLHKRTEEEIRQLAYYDPLTHLPNRAFFLEQLDRALATARRTGDKVALLFCDLDDFKHINDTLGHDRGDLLLQELAGRLNDCIRRGDTLCRLGGDEFVLLLPALNRENQAAVVANKIQEALLPAFDVDGHQIHTRGSIGIALYPADGADAGTLFKHADTAMYAAKEAGRNCYRFFSEEMNRRSRQRLEVDSGLRQALVRDELSLVWQPQFDLEQGGLIGAEALLRWSNPEMGNTPPSDFIPVAEESGIIQEIGAWVLQTACVQARTWQEQGHPAMRVAVNLSGSQFKEPGLTEMVGRILQETGLSADLLELEITESVFMGDIDQAMDTLHRMRDLGVRFAIDDFGTGFSSLRYLKEMPIGRIKIARDFVKDITTNKSDAAIASTVIEMARSLSMQALAEGVETQEQADRLRQMHCPEVQGFFFSPPLTTAEFQRLL